MRMGVVPSMPVSTQQEANGSSGKDAYSCCEDSLHTYTVLHILSEAAARESCVFIAKASLQPPQ